MRSFFAFAAFVVFGFNAATMSADNWGDLTPIYEGIRPILIGLALLSLTQVEWGKLGAFLDRWVQEVELADDRPAPDRPE